jgi:hypothetical protein
VFKSKPKMKKRTKKIIFIIIGILVLLFLFRTIYKNFDFEKDKQTFVALITKAGTGKVVDALDEMRELESLTNPIINYKYQSWKKKMHTRFVSENEIIENTSGNKIINDISNIYRDYWRTELLKKNPENRTDTTLYITLTNYILSNHLTSLSQDSLSKNIKDDSELKKIIEAQGFKSDFKFRNGFQELFIWNKEMIKDYEVTLPKDTINTKVVFIEEFHITGYDDYATCGNTQVGGWAIKESATLYCNNGYDLSSEKFNISYLKHESLHFTDLNEYPNLSSADLEYRAKAIELMYCTEKSIYSEIAEFIHGADSSDRSHSHLYANYILIKKLSKLLFTSEYESDLNKWRQLSVEEINRAASELYHDSENILQKDKDVAEII